LAIEVSNPAANEVALTESNSFAAYFVWATVATLSLMLLAAIVAAPIALTQHHSAFAATIYSAFSYLCHQIPERSFHIAGHPFAVCSRCTGLYTGFALATLSYPLFRSLKRTDTPGLIWLFASAVPLAVDFSLTYFGIWQNNHFTRFTTGALFGAVAAIYVVPGLIELAGKSLRYMSNIRSRPPSRSGF
jgi:uncharacterized membrane protein